ncbi:MAG: tetratricopeptide repeat protein, partial [Proteobacteria bacterium]|nr:tetratricopeptide repeat protein [Pseudomonadota bacterium]
AIFTAALLFSVAVAVAGDPADFFLKAYQDYQAGEKFERDGRLRDAMNSYASTVAILEQVRKDDPSWQEIVVNFRMRKAQENIERLRAMVASEPEKLPSHEDPLPTRGFEIDIPEPAVTTRPRQQRAETAKKNESGSEVTSEQIASLERQVAEYRKLHAEEKKKREALEGDVASVKMELEKTKTELVATNSNLAQTDGALQNITQERDALKKKAGEPQDKRIEKLSDRIARLEAENEVAQDENTRLVGKLEKAAAYISESKKVLSATDEDRRNVATQRDKALARIKRLKDNDGELDALKAEKAAFQKQLATQKPDLERLAKMESENKELAQRLVASEKKLAEASNVGGLSKAEAEGLQEEIGLLQDRLAASRQDLVARDASVKSLMAQLDEATGELARLRLNPEPSEEQKRLFTESQLLRQIVLRQIHEQSERTQVVSDLEKELERLQVQSEALASSVGILSNPPPVLKEEERALFREPIVVLKDPEVEAADLSLTVVKPSNPASTPRQSSGGADALTGDTKKLAVEASSLAKQRRFTDAEKKYQQVVDAAPENHFALANLAVTQIQAGKLSAAQVALEKALSLKSDDIFASVNLANVYCRQGRFDDSIAILNRVITADPKNAAAHNYLAIALGKKGDTAKAEESFRESLAIDPNYANAHFNLAVMYANAEPPSLQLAKKHYEKAKALGAEPDSVLERRLAQIQPAN